METPIGNLPDLNSIDLEGLALDENGKASLLRVDIEGWLQEIPLINQYFDKFGDRLPAEFRTEVESFGNSWKRQNETLPD